MSTCYCDEYGYPHPFDRQFCGTHPTSGPLLPTRPLPPDVSATPLAPLSTNETREDM